MLITNIDLYRCRYRVGKSMTSWLQFFLAMPIYAVLSSVAIHWIFWAAIGEHQSWEGIVRVMTILPLSLVAYGLLRWFGRS